MKQLAVLVLLAGALVWRAGRSHVVLAQPTNDNFANALSVSLAPNAYFADTEDTTGATVEPGEPNPACGSVVNTVWYRFTPTVADLGGASSGTVDLDTFSSQSGSTYVDTVLAVYVGPGTLAGLAEIGCNNDDATPQMSSASRASALAIVASAGTTYYVQAGGLSNPASGTVSSGNSLQLHVLLPFFNPGNGSACEQDHAADSQGDALGAGIVTAAGTQDIGWGDGYSDSDQATPFGAPTPPCFDGAFPKGGGLAEDTLSFGNGCMTDPYLARSDVNLDGVVNILDMSLIAHDFLTSWSDPRDHRAELDINRSHHVDILDLSLAGGRYLLFVAQNCGGGAGSEPCSEPGGTTLNMVVLTPAAGCARPVKTTAPDGTFIYTLYWDRAPRQAGHTTDDHTISVLCPGGGTVIATTASGKYSFVGITAPPCTISFDTYSLGSF